MEMAASSINTSAIIQNPNDVTLVKDEVNAWKRMTTQVGALSGRAISSVQTGGQAFFAKTGEVFTKGLDVVGAHVEDPVIISSICKKMELHCLPLVEHLKDAPDQFKKLKPGLRAARDTIDVLQLACDADYFITRKYKGDSKQTIAARISLLITNIFGTCAALIDFGCKSIGTFFNSLGNVRVFSFVPKLIASVPGLRDMPRLQRIAESIGNVHVFGVFNKLSLGYIAERFLGLTYAFFAADAIRRLIQPGTAVQKKFAGIELASSVSEVGLNVMTAVGVTNIIGLGILGTVCLSLAVTRFVYNHFHEKEIKQHVK